MPRRSVRAFGSGFASTFVPSVSCAALVVASLGLSPQRAVAQRDRDLALPDARREFEDSWYWGAKGGVTRFGTVADGRTSAPLAGGEWLVTHRRGALLVSAEQAFFDGRSLVADPFTKDGVREVSIEDSRRYAAAALAAPVALGRLRPYAGVGLALHVMRRAQPRGDFATAEQYWGVRDRIASAESIVAPFLIGGAQLRVGIAALFVQGVASGEQSRSLWNLGGSAQLEGGVRINVASAFER